MRYFWRLLSVIVFSTTLLGGCTAMTGKTAGHNIDDATITASVKTNLASAKASTLARVDVDTNNGVVSLNGVVEDPTMRQRAVEIAQQTSGVKKVINNLQVQASR